MKYSRDDILDSAVDLIDREGIGVSTARVAAHAGVSNGTLFHYFPTKQDFIDALYLRVKRSLADAIGETDVAVPPEDRAHQVWDRWVAWALSAPARHRVVLLLKGGGVVRPEAVSEAAALFSGVTDVLDAAAKDGTLVPMPLPYLAAVVEAQVDVAVTAQLDGAARDTAFDMAWASISSRLP